MYNCNDEISAYHKEGVTLPQSEQDEMRRRRNTNRSRLENRLVQKGDPTPSEFKSQGSYAHRTMVQQPDKDYDIDDGVYFWKDDLEGPRGGDMTALDAKKTVRSALEYSGFKTPPEVRTNCVRVYYDAGYHVDVPVYRKMKTKDPWTDEDKTHYELASSDWKESDPAEVTRWFRDENIRQSPDTTDGRQLRRLTRLCKAFARSRESWRPRIATGFMITTLIVKECYRANIQREDKALYDTMVAMRDRLNWNLDIRHPINPGENLTKDSNEGRTKFLRDKLNWAIDVLQVLFDGNCMRSQALEAWDRVFNTTYFGGNFDDSAGDMRAEILIRNGEDAATRDPVDKRGGGRYA